MTSTRTTRGTQGAFKNTFSHLGTQAGSAVDSLFSHSTGFSTLAPQDLPTPPTGEHRLLMMAAAILGLGIVVVFVLTRVLPS
jgi:hypothetical protein